MLSLPATTEFPWQTTKIMTNAEAVERLLDVLSYRTVYVNATFGHTLDDALSNSSIMASRENESRRTYYEERNDYGYFGFDCSGFIKSVLLWNWKGDYGAKYGGADYIYDAVDEQGNKYNSQDINQDGFISICEDVDTNFSNILPGEFLYIQNKHCGIYIGNGYAIECTKKGELGNEEKPFYSGVMITQVENMISDDSQRDWSVEKTHWTSHGKLPFIHYGDSAEEGIQLTLNQHSYSPGEAIDVTVEGIDSTQYIYSRAYLYKQNNRNGLFRQNRPKPVGLCSKRSTRCGACFSSRCKDDISHQCDCTG